MYFFINIIKKTLKKSNNLLKKGLCRIYQFYFNNLRIFGINVGTLIIIPLSIICLARFDKIRLFWDKNFIEKIEKITFFLKEDDLINGVVYFFIGLALLYFFWRRWTNKHISLNNLVICSFLGILLFSSKDYYVYYPLNFYINYYHVSIIAISLYLLIYLIRFAKQIIFFCERSKINNAKQTHDVGWDEYANNLINKLLENNVKMKCFSLGITGRWGSGKTSFLHMLKQKLEKDAYVIDFNPWNSNISKQITDDFFNTIRTKLTPYYRSLSKPLRKYSDLLIELDLNKGITSITQFFSSNIDNSLDGLKTEVEKCLVQFDKPIIIIIDDLDRLNGDEILEVFKLIRNSAQFENVIYIAAYDKRYIHRSLEGEGIKNPESYIEKLFSLEISLPAFESEILPNLLLEYISSVKNKIEQNKYKELEQVIYTIKPVNDNGYSSYLFTDYLPTFRSVERFGYQFEQNLTMFIQKKLITEISISDLFWIEILHYSDEEVYEFLKINFEKLLEISNGHYVYSIKEGSNVKNETSILLAKLFPKYSKAWNSIQKPEFFNRYFSFRLMTNQISISSFQSALNSNDDKFLEYIENNRNIKATSLLNVFNTFTLKSASTITIVRFFKGALHFYLRNENRRLLFLLEKILLKSNLPEDSLVLLSETIKEVIIKNINDKEHLSLIGILLSNLFGVEYFYDYCITREEKFVLANSTIEELAKCNFYKYLEDNPFSIVYFKEKTPQNNFLVSNVKTYTYNDPSDQTITVHYNLVLDILLEYMKKLTNPEYEYLIDKKFNYELFSNEYDEYEHEDKISEVQNIIQKYFGELDKYKDILKNDSEISPKRLDKYFERIQI